MENIILDDQHSSTPIRYAGFWIRVAAYLVDTVILYAIFFVLALVFGVSMFTNPTPGPAVYLFIVLELAIAIGYFVYFESSAKQATFGKQVVGLQVGRMDGSRISMGQALGRYLGKILSTIILFIGFIMVAWDQKRQSLHDKLAGTIVYYK